MVWTSPYFGPVNNYAGFKDDKCTQLTLAVYSEGDPSKRKPVYDTWNDFVLDQTPVTAICTQLPPAVARPNVRGTAYSIGGNYLDVTGAWLADRAHRSVSASGRPVPTSVDLRWFCTYGRRPIRRSR